MNTKFGTNVSNRMLLNAAKFQGYSFYRFCVIKGKPTDWGRGVKPPPPRLGLNQLLLWVNELFSIYFQKCDNNSF